MNEAQTALRGTERAQKGLTVPLSRIFAALVGHTGPTKLARKFQTDTRPFVAALEDERPEWQRVGQPWMSSPSHDVLADRMDDDEDPRADIIRGRLRESGPGGGINHIGALANAADTGTGPILEALADQRIFRTGDRNNVDVTHPDGGRTQVHRIRIHLNNAVYHLTAHVRTPGSIGQEYHAVMNHEQFNRWRDSMEPDERAKFLFPDEQPSTAPPGPDSVDANIRMKNTHLARAGDALTWVGGHVPGGQRAQGFWTGGTEKSTVVRVPSQFVDRAAVEIAKRNNQKSALWFTPGEGSDVLHVLGFPSGYPRSLSRILKKHGVSEFTITQNPVSVHVVDKGGILGGAVRSAAAESGAQYTLHAGTAGYAELKSGPTKLSRESDEAAFHAAMAADPTDHVTRLVYADKLEEDGHKQAADRLRWFAGLIPHLKVQPYDRAVRPSSTLAELPEWASAIVRNHVWRTVPRIPSSYNASHPIATMWPHEEHALIHEREPDPAIKSAAWSWARDPGRYAHDLHSNLGANMPAIEAHIKENPPPV